MRLILISGPVERETDRMLEAACAARDLPCVTLVPGRAAGLDLGAPGERRLIYRTGVSQACITAEMLLYRAGDAAMHDPHFHYSQQAVLFQLAGLPRPRTIFVPDPDRAALGRQVENLGGFPVVVKQPGQENGHGVSLARDLAALVEHIATSPGVPTLEAFVPHTRCWRVTVLAGKVLATTARVAGDGDFRTNGPGSGPVRDADAPDGLGEIALRAARTLRLEFGGADIMEADGGQLYLGEFNFPCFFADQQRMTGVDIAGAIVERLMAMPPHPTAGHG